MADGPWGAAASGGGVGPWATNADSGPTITGSIGGKKNKGKSILGFANNVVDSAQNALGAVIPGIKLGAESVAHDMFPGGLDSFNPFNKESYKEGWDNPFSAKTWKDELQKLKTGEVATKLVVPAAKSYKQRYTDGFWNNLYNDPIPFVLDFTTGVGVGVNTAAKVGANLERAGKISSTSKLAQLSKPSEIEFSVNGVDKVTKFTSNRPTTRAAQKAWNKTLMTLPPETRWLGEYARAGVLLRKRTDVDAIRNQLVATEYLNAMSRLNKTERVALAILQEVPTRELLEGWKRVITEQGDGGPSNLAQLNDPKVMALFDAPSEKMLNVHRLAGELGDANVKLAGTKGGVNPAKTDARPYLSSLVAAGARFVPDPEEMSRRGLDAPARAGEMVGKLTIGGYVKAHDRDNYGMLVDVQGDTATVHFVNRKQGVEATVDLPVSKLSPASADVALARVKKIMVAPDGGSVDGLLAQVKQSIVDSGRPLPVYRPHASVMDKKGLSWGGSGGIGIPNQPGVRRNEAVLFQLGRLALDVDLLGPAYMRTVKYALYTDRHNLLLQHAIPADHLPTGYVLIRRTRGEKMSYTDRTQDQFQEDLRNSIDGDKPPVDMDLTTTRLDDAEVDSEGRYMVVPKSFADNVVGEFGRSYSVPNRIFQSSMTVWRALVLGLRPAWLVNNIIGNHLLAAIRFAGVDGLRAYLNAIYNTKGAGAVRRMLGMQDMPRGLSQQFMREFFPEQVHGTFMGTQMPTGAAGKWGKRASLGLAPIDKASEGMLRRTSVEAALRRSPEVRAQANKMLVETRTFEEIARDAIMSNRGVAERASAEVNAALGDFLTLGQFEKNFVRQLIPFYAWFKAITKVTLRLPVDMPIRANLLANLSALGAASTEEQFGSPLPNYLKSSVSMGKNRLFRTSGISPFSTVAQLMSAGRSALPGANTQNTRDLIGLFNPFLAEAQTVLNPFSPPKFGTIAQIPFDVLRNTPQARILFPRDSKLYEDSARERAIFGYFGAPMGDINRSKAAKDAADGK